MSDTFEIYYEIDSRLKKQLTDTKLLKDLQYYEFGIYFKINGQIVGNHVEFLLWVLDDFLHNIITKYPSQPIVLPGRDDPVVVTFEPMQSKYEIKIVDERHPTQMTKVVIDKKRALADILSFSENLIEDILKINKNLENYEIIINIKTKIQKLKQF